VGGARPRGKRGDTELEAQRRPHRRTRGHKGRKRTRSPRSSSSTNNSDDGTRETIEERFGEVNFIVSPHKHRHPGAQHRPPNGTRRHHPAPDNDGVLEAWAVEKMPQGLSTPDPSIAVVHCREPCTTIPVKVFDPFRWFTPAEHERTACSMCRAPRQRRSIRRDVLEETDYSRARDLLYQLSATSPPRGYHLGLSNSSTTLRRPSRHQDLARENGLDALHDMTGGVWFLARFYPGAPRQENVLLHDLCAVYDKSTARQRFSIRGRRTRCSPT